MHINRKPFLIAAVGILIFIVLLVSSPGMVKAFGKAHLQNRIDTASEPIKYQNRLYEYNENIITFLIMGIDKGKETYEPWEAEIENIGNGQADALFLAALNIENNTVKIIGINRNTMTDIYLCDNLDGSIPTFVSQIALQHAYGPNRQIGCEYQVKAVQNLFYQLPIHGYVAVNVDVVPTMNDLVGGVDVDVLEDLTLHDPSLMKGSHVHLMGESAYWYVKYRDIHQFASVDMRAQRQSQYLNGFINAAKQTVREDPLLVFQLYEELAPEMDTNITKAEMAYLASVLPQCQFDENSFCQIPGETVMGEKYEEFYPDEDALLTLIVDIFYREVSTT